MFAELIAKYDSRKSFYHKAVVEYSVSGELKLFSYNSLVARLYQGKLAMCGPWDRSADNPQTLQGIRLAE